MKTASMMMALAARRSHAFAWLAIAADRRRNGLIGEARTAVGVSRLWDNPKLPDRAKPILMQAAE